MPMPPAASPSTSMAQTVGAGCLRDPLQEGGGVIHFVRKRKSIAQVDGDVAVVGVTMKRFSVGARPTGGSRQLAVRAESHRLWARARVHAGTRPDPHYLLTSSGGPAMPRFARKTRLPPGGACFAKRMTRGLDQVELLPRRFALRHRGGGGHRAVTTGAGASLAAGICSCFDRQAEAFGDVERARAIGRRQHERELVAMVAGREVARPPDDVGHARGPPASALHRRPCGRTAGCRRGSDRCPGRSASAAGRHDGSGATRARGTRETVRDWRPRSANPRCSDAAAECVPTRAPWYGYRARARARRPSTPAVAGCRTPRCRTSPTRLPTPQWPAASPALVPPLTYGLSDGTGILLAAG